MATIPVSSTGGDPVVLNLRSPKRVRLDEARPVESEAELAEPAAWTLPPHFPSWMSDGETVALDALWEIATGPLSPDFDPYEAKATDVEHAAGTARAAQEQARPLRALRWGIEAPLQAEHGALAELKLSDTVSLRPVRIAEQDEGLLTALVGEEARGVFSTGFAVCLTVIFRNEAGVGLLHTSQGEEELPGMIEEEQADFHNLTGSFASVTIGHFPEGHRDQLLRDAMEERAMRSAASASANPVPSRVQPDDEEMAKIHSEIDGVIAERAQEAQRVAEIAQRTAAGRYSVTCVRMSGCMVAVETDGTLHGLAE